MKENRHRGYFQRSSKIRNREYKESEKLMCNIFPLKHEGRTRVRGEMLYEYVLGPGRHRRKTCTNKHIYTKLETLR